jgi:hypothetical protein
MKNLAIACLGLMCAATSLAGGQSATYNFLEDESILTISGGIMGLHFESPILGSFQLAVDSTEGTARFDWVNASFMDLGGLGSEDGDIGRLFNMTQLAGKRIGPREFEFTGQSTGEPKLPLRLRLVFLNGRVHLTGGFPPPGTCCDFFFYEIDAVAVPAQAPCAYRLAGDLNDDCRVTLADLAILAANWLADCNGIPLDSACIPK